jgi:hypothetical protein
LKTSFFDRANKPFRIGIAPRRSWCTTHRLDARSIEGISKGLGELRIEIHDEKSMVSEEAVKLIGEVTRNL